MIDKLKEGIKVVGDITYSFRIIFASAFGLLPYIFYSLGYAASPGYLVYIFASIFGGGVGYGLDLLYLKIKELDK